MTRIVYALLACGLVAAGPTSANADNMNHAHAAGHAMKHGHMSISGAWVRATPPRAKMAAAYLTVTNRSGKADRLIAAATNAAAKTELHTHAMTNGVMKMRQIPAIQVPAHGTAEIKPGADHIMLIGLKNPLKAGGMTALTLVFEHAGKITIKVPIQKHAPKPHRRGGMAGDGANMVKVMIHSITANGLGPMIGTIVLSETGSGVKAVPDLKHLSPGRHGFHVHQNGSCAAGLANSRKAAGQAAGGHYDRKVSHGMTAGHGHTHKHGHMMTGDMPALTADAAGHATRAVLNKGLTLAEIKGRSLMIHAWGDGAPPGPAPRIACGVIPK